MMLVRLALGNVHRTLHDYAIYAVTLVLGVAVFYAFNTIAAQAPFLQGNVSAALATAREILMWITVFLAVIMGFLMVYANSFLMRHRTRELGLYQVLGMRPNQVNAVLIIETLAVALISLAIGLLAGMLLSQLMVFVTAAMFETNVSHFHFFVSGYALGLTLGCFALMFLVMMVLNAWSLSRVRLVNLMGAGARNQQDAARSLPANIALFAAGVVLIALAYWRLTNQGIPGFSANGAANNDEFALTTILVIAGTILFFYGIAGTAVQTIMRLRGFYWRDLHAFTLRQITARVNTACASMAIIAMILFLAITSVTTGITLVQAINGQNEGLAPFDASIVAFGDADDTVKGTDLVAAMRKAGVDPETLGDYAQVELRYTTSPKHDEASDLSLPSIAKAAGQDIPASLNDYADSQGAATVISISDYNANRKLLGLEPVKLDGNQYLVLASDSADAAKLVEGAMASGHRFTVAGTALSPARETVIDDRSHVLQNESNVGLLGLVVPDAVAAECAFDQATVNIQYTGNADQAEAALGEAFSKKLNKNLPDSAVVFTKEQLVLQTQATNGTITYLALYIGFVLVIACAAILAIQQLSAAADATRNYRTLRELGCSDRMIFGSLRTQILVAFALPLAVGIAHSICALSTIVPPLAQYGFANLGGAVTAAGGVFMLAYGAYLVFTYRTARGIVQTGLHTGRRA